MAVRTFGEKLRKLRNDAGLTQQQLAKELGISYTTIKDLESKPEACMNLRTESSLKILDFFKCDLAYLFGEQEQPRKEIASAAAITGLSYPAVEVLASWNANASVDLDAISSILSSSPATVQKIIRLMYNYIGLKKHEPDSKSLLLSANQEILEIMDSDEKDAIRRRLSGKYSEFATEYILTKAGLTADDIAVVFLKSAQDELSNLFCEMLNQEKSSKKNGGSCNGEHKEDNE